ncbi:MAG: hypothetical protein CMH64_00385 [Nanoarchaeota archaeon]|nr:hypothetical protein [Nanoarchaeota archaeon]|tara:strand:- start:322 stop:1020 length:699 start_codon:yes stop_codon:yes gene_type:complete
MADRSLDELVDEMARVGQLEQVRRGYNEAQTEEEKDALRNLGYKALAAGLNNQSETFDEELDVLADNLDKNPYNRISEGVQNGARGIIKDYETHLDAIYERIESKLNGELSKITDMDDERSRFKAVNSILFYFARALEVSKPNQEELDEQIVNNVRNGAGISVTGNYAGVGNPEKARQITYRLLAGKYVSEDKDDDGKTIGYKINSEELKELVEKNPLVGSILYSIEKPEEK